jgi:uncharacterized phage infection (PIP) family protein YhgE
MEATEESLNPERDALYKQYEESQAAETAPEEAEASEVTEKEELPPEETPEGEGEAATAAEFADTPPEAEKQVEAEEKTVSLAALHEERAKRKALSGEVTELKTQVQQLIKDNMALMEKRPEPEDGDELATRKEIYERDRRIEQLEKQLEQYGSQYQADIQNRQQEALNRRIEETDKQLSSEGFPGFKDIGRHIVGQMLATMDAEDVREMDNPAGWMQLYKSEYPKLRGHFVTQAKQEAFDAKKTQKEKANLAGTAGRGKQPKAEEKEWGYDDYIKMRREKGLT